MDFCCLEERLILELDGSIHAQPSQGARDGKRDEWLRRLGYTVVRFPSGLVSVPEEFDKRVLCVLTKLRAERIASSVYPFQPPRPRPLSPKGGEGSKKPIRGKTLN